LNDSTDQADDRVSEWSDDSVTFFLSVRQDHRPPLEICSKNPWKPNSSKNRDSPWRFLSGMWIKLSSKAEIKSRQWFGHICDWTWERRLVSPKLVLNRLYFVIR
jgi:hypothetical protein